MSVNYEKKTILVSGGTMMAAIALIWLACAQNPTSNLRWAIIAFALYASGAVLSGLTLVYWARSKWGDRIRWASTVFTWPTMLKITCAAATTCALACRIALNDNVRLLNEACDYTRTFWPYSWLYLFLPTALCCQLAGAAIYCVISHLISLNYYGEPR